MLECSRISEDLAASRSFLELSWNVLGRSWALLGAVLGCPAGQLGAKLASKKAAEADKTDLENYALYRRALALPFPVFDGFQVPTRSHVGTKSHL